MNCRIIRVAGLSIMMVTPFALGIVNAESDIATPPADIRQEYVLELEENAEAEAIESNSYIDAQDVASQ